MMTIPLCLDNDIDNVSVAVYINGNLAACRLRLCLLGWSDACATGGSFV